MRKNLCVTNVDIVLLWKLSLSKIIGYPHQHHVLHQMVVIPSNSQKSTMEEVLQNAVIIKNSKSKNKYIFFVVFYVVHVGEILVRIQISESSFGLLILLACILITLARQISPVKEARVYIVSYCSIMDSMEEYIVRLKNIACGWIRPVVRRNK